MSPYVVRENTRFRLVSGHGRRKGCRTFDGGAAGVTPPHGPADVGFVGLPVRGRSLHASLSGRLRRQDEARPHGLPGTGGPGRGAPVVREGVHEEAVLRRPLGGESVRRGRTEHLLPAGEQRNVGIRAMPLSRGQHAGLAGPFTSAETRDERGSGRAGLRRPWLGPGAVTAPGTVASASGRPPGAASCTSATRRTRRVRWSASHRRRGRSSSGSPPGTPRGTKREHRRAP